MLFAAPGPALIFDGFGCFGHDDSWSTSLLLSVELSLPLQTLTRLLHEVVSHVTSPPDGPVLFCSLASVVCRL